MKKPNVSVLLFLPIIVLSSVPSFSLVSCGNKVSDFELTHSGDFIKQFDNCKSNESYSVSFDFTSNKDIDLNKYDLKCNSDSWLSEKCSFNYTWSKSNNNLTLTIDVKLDSNFEIQSQIETSSLCIDLVEKSNPKVIKSFSFGILQIRLNQQLSENEFIVSFDINGANNLISAQKISLNETASKPSDPSKQNYDFVNWYSDNLIFDFTTKITKNITLSAHWTDSNPYDYIWNRTFSLGCWGDLIPGQAISLNWGTCWILSDATPADTSDFQYWIATNWHVTARQDQIRSETTNFKIGFADDKKSEGIKEIDGYTLFKSYQVENYDKFYYDKGNKKAIDFVVAKADFSGCNETTKQKLNKLNYQQKTQGCINNIYSTTTSQQFLSGPLYIGGFPVIWSNATWENHEINPSDFEFNQQHIHTLSQTAYDFSYQYESKINYTTDWMTTGASGSMLITKIQNEWSPIGIYWGGWKDGSDTSLYPSFSVFKSDVKDFTKDYIK